MKHALLSLNGKSLGPSRLAIFLLAFLSFNQLAFAQPVVSLNSSTDVSCFGGNDGAIDINVSGGISPYTFYWSNGDNSQNISGLDTGSYSVVVVDANLDSANLSGVVISQPDELAVVYNVSNVSCYGDANGAVNLTVSGGTAPYTYIWSSGETTQNISGKSSGFFSVTVTDSAGCTKFISSIVVLEPSEFKLQSQINTHVSCFGGNDGETEVQLTGGLLPYTYLWDDGSTANTRSNLTAGTYTLTATDQNSCTTVVNVTINEPAAPLSAVVDITNTTCVSSSDGQIDLTVSGGTAPYSYLWNTGDTTEDLTVPTGSYSVTITDGNGCTLLENAVVSNDDTIPPVAACRTIPLILDASGNASITAIDLDYGSTDNCVIDTIILSNYNFGCADLGLTPVDLYVIDENGNSDTCTGNVNVFDTIAPTLNTINITAYLDASGQATISAADVDAGTLDACGLDTIYISRNQFFCGDIGVQNLMFTAADVNGNSRSTSITVTVADTISPDVITQDISLYLAADGTASISAADIDNGSSDACGIDTLVLSQYNFDCAVVGIQMVSLSVTDLEGNVGTATASVTVIDTISPALSASGKTVYLDATGSVSINAADLVNAASDSCGIDTITLSTYNFSCAEVGANPVTVSAIDNNGNTTTVSVSVTVSDTNKPDVIARDINAYLDAAGQVSITVADIDSATTAVCGMDTILLNKYNFSCADTGVNMVMLIAVSNNGVFNSDTALVTVIDTISGNLTTQNQTIYLDAAGQASVTAADLSNSSSDACGIDTTTLSKYDFSCADAGANTVMVTLLDIHGNSRSASATVTVVDTIKPVVSTIDITLNLDASGNASIVATDVMAANSDNCAVDTLILDRYNFVCADAGVQVVTLQAIDAAGNSASATAQVTVVDTTDPVITSAPFDAYLDANGAVSITAADVTATLSDACGTPAVAIDISNFDCTNLGANTVTLTATDASGNIATATATVTVYDTISPALSVANVDLYLDTAATMSLRDVNPVLYLFEACSLDSVYLSRENFGCADLGATKIGVTAVDAEGNLRSDSLIVNVIDTTGPSLTSNNLTVYLDNSGNTSITAAQVNTMASDVCGIDTLYLDRYTFSCTEVGTNTVTLTAVDVNGQSTTVLTTVTVADTILPVVNAQNVTIYSDANGIATISPADIDNGSYDGNCSSSVLTLSDSIFDCSELGLNLETLTITDAGGNSRTVDFFITVIDTIKPTLALKNITVMLNQAGTASISANQLDSASSDNCSNLLSFSASKTSFNCNDLGANVISVYAEDAKMNSATGTAVVTVIDGSNPTVATRNINAYLDANGSVTALATDVNNGSFDNCGLDSLWLSRSVFSASDLGPNNATLYVQDPAGNVAFGSAVITVIDTVKPQIANQNLDLYLDASGQANFTSASYNLNVTDNHSVASLSTANAVYDCSQRGINTVSVTATDPSGNSRVATLTINVIDTLAPSLQLNGATVYLDANGNASLSVADVDAGSSDNCGIQSITLNRSNFSCADLGSNMVMVSAMDADSNMVSDSVMITVVDNIAPSLSSVPANITTGSDAGSCGAVVNFVMPATSDNCSNANLTSTHQPGDLFPVGSTRVIFTTQDAAGNTDTAGFNVTVIDDQAPQIISMPLTDTVGQCNALYSFSMPLASDNCSNASVTQISGLPSGGFYPIGTTTNSFRISDSNGNDTIVSFDVVVMPASQPNLPQELNLCANEAPVDFTLGQAINWSGKGIQNASSFNPALAGTGRHVLNYTYFDEYGCMTNGSISITVSPIPVEPVISRSGANTLTTGAYDTYQWYRDGIAITGANSQSYSYTIGGNYQVMVSNTAACENHSKGYVVGSANGGIGIEENLLGELSLYPNPTNGVLTIDLNNLMKKELQVSLYNISGKKLMSVSDFTEADGKMIINLNQLPKATYVLRIQSEDQVVVRQVVLY